MTVKDVNCTLFFSITFLRQVFASRNDGEKKLHVGILKSNAQFYSYLVIQSEKVIALLFGAITFSSGIPYFKRIIILIILIPLSSRGRFS